MPRKCQISGKGTAFGNTVSHSHVKNRRKFKINLIRKRVYIAHENRWARLRLSTRVLRTLNKRGVKSLMRQYGQDLNILRKDPKDEAFKEPEAKLGAQSVSTEKQNREK